MKVTQDRRALTECAAWHAGTGHRGSLQGGQLGAGDGAYEKTSLSKGFVPAGLELGI